MASSAAAEFVKGIVVDIKKDTVDVMDEAGKVVTLRVTDDLLAGKVRTQFAPHQFKQLAMGQLLNREIRTYVVDPPSWKCHSGRR